jgi:hypothetical protein
MHALTQALPQSSDFDAYRVGLTLFAVAALAVYFNWERIRAHRTRKRIRVVERKLARDFPALQESYRRRP